MKWIYLSAGFLLVALAAVGLFLPLLPTTPLLLLAAACFTRTSERWHNWLIHHKTFGPVIRSWQDSRSIPLKAKRTAIASIIIFGTYAIGFAIESMPLRIIGLILLLTGLITVLRIPVDRKPKS